MASGREDDWWQLYSDLDFAMEAVGTVHGICMGIKYEGGEIRWRFVSWDSNPENPDQDNRSSLSPS